MEPLSKQFEALATSWKRDLLFRARIKLTFIYTMVAAFLLAVFSYILYGQLLSRLQDSIDDKVVNPIARELFFQRAADAIQSQILIADSIVLLFILVFGYVLTKLTLRPIRETRDRERRFLADAAHELRTPLAVMKTGTEVVLRSETELPARMKKLLSENIEEIDSLTRIANGLLALVAEKEKIASTRSLVSLNEILFGVVKKLISLARTRDVILSSNIEEHGDDIRLYADLIALTRAFENVVENAIKYTKPGGTVSIALERKGKSAMVKVKDTGVGISPEDISRVIEPFYRADTARAAIDGSGLGLSIVSETVQAHNGSLTIESTLGIGTMVSITLPLAMT